MEAGLPCAGDGQFTGRFRRNFGSLGSRNGEFETPAGVAVHGDEVYTQIGMTTEDRVGKQIDARRGDRQDLARVAVCRYLLGELRSQGSAARLRHQKNGSKSVPALIRESCICISAWPRGGGFSGVGSSRQRRLEPLRGQWARRRRTPVASKIALAMAPATERVELSLAPAGGSSGRLISTMSTASGASVMSRIG